jgi:predicted ATP-grasp superfamily ATP-dependent carboligase
MTPLPPAIVLGIDTPIGLTVIRELGAHGVPVYGIARTPAAVGLHSRWLARGYLRPAADDRLRDLLNKIAEREGAPFLLTISEADALFAASNRENGGFPKLRPLVPPSRILRLVNDKAATCEVAAELGIEIPEKWQPGAAQAEPPQHLKYPCILKWADPGRIAPLLARHDLPLRKTQYCYSPEELRAALHAYAALDRFPMVQSFAPGFGLGHLIFMHTGEPLLRFRHQRLSEWPPEGGSSSVCRSLPLLENDPLFARSVALLRRIGWEGAAMVEYRHDETTGRSVLMEINGRFWGSLPLANHCGAPFAWLTYAVLGLGRNEEAPSYRAGLVCRYMVPETRRLFTILFRPGDIQNRDLTFNRARETGRFIGQFLDPRTRYYVFRWRDPMPFIADMLAILRKLLRRAPRKPKAVATAKPGG